MLGGGSNVESCMPAGIIMIMCLPAAGAEGPSLKLKFSIRPVAAGLRTSR